MTPIRNALRDAAEALAAAGTPEPRLEAEVLLAEALGKPRTYLFAHPDLLLPTPADEVFFRWLERRCAGEPIAYIRGHQEFWSLDLRVTPATLIPRPETELLVEIALRELPPDVPLRIADLGTGCGAIALALASERPSWQVHGSDTSPEALAVAQANRDRLGLRNLDLRVGRWLEPFGAGQFDAILSNPPYVAESDAHLRQGDLRFELLAALVSGPSGLDAIGEIVVHAPAHLEPGGRLWLEHGWDQGLAVRSLLDEGGLAEVCTWRDLEGRERVSGGRVENPNALVP